MAKRLFILIQIIALTACSSSVTPILTPGSVTQESNCSLPCWNGVLIGKTTRPEFLERLGKLSYLNREAVTMSNKRMGIYDSRAIFFLYPNNSEHNKGTILGEADVINNTVVMLVFVGELKITFGELIKATGDPKYIINQANPFGGNWVTAINPKIVLHMDTILISCLRIWNFN